MPRPERTFLSMAYVLGALLLARAVRNALAGTPFEELTQRFPRPQIWRIQRLAGAASYLRLRRNFFGARYRSALKS